MGKIRSPKDLGTIKTPEEFSRHASKVIQESVDVVNGKLEFDKNFASQTVSVTFPTANTDVAVTHSLKKKVTGYLVASKSVDCSIYAGSKEPTLNTLYLKSTVAATVTLVLL